MGVAQTPSKFLYHILETTQNELFQKTNILNTYSSFVTAMAKAQSWPMGEKCGKLVLKEVCSVEESNGLIQGKGVIVRARTDSGSKICISICATPNDQGLLSDEQGLVFGPLHYVIQTQLNYKMNQNGDFQSSKLQGIFADRSQAVTAAKMVLLGDDVRPQDFVLYEELDEQEDYPWGPDGIVHAVKYTGEEYLISVDSRWTDIQESLVDEEALLPNL